MKILLVVLYTINGQLTMLAGFHPREQPSMEVCEERKEFLKEYIETLPDMPPIGLLMCGTPEEVQQRIHEINNTSVL